MLYITYALNGLVMIGLPLALGFFLSRRFGARWSVFGLGMASFLASQIIHLPLVLWLQTSVVPAPKTSWELLVYAAMLGLLAGLFEGAARYLVLRYWAKSARTWREALMFGAGHGGLEAIILGVLVLVAYVNMVALRNANLSALGLSADQQAALAKQLAAYWSAPWYLTLLGAVERLFALCLHVSAAVLVMRAITRRNLLWLAAAVLWHALIDGTTVVAAGVHLGAVRIEGVLGAFALASLLIIFVLRPRQPEPAVEIAPSVIVAGAPASPRSTNNVQAEAKEQVDQSKYAD